MKNNGDFWPFLLYAGWLFLVGSIVKETKASEWFFVIAIFAPIVVAVAIQSWKEDKNRKD